MAVVCPTCGRADTVETLADRFSCSNHDVPVFIDYAGVLSTGGLLWTSEVPVSQGTDAATTTTAYEAQS